MIGLIIAVSIALGVSSLCSLTEAVIYSVPWSYIERLRRSGSKSGNLIFELRTDIDRSITAILTLNTIAHTAGAAVAGAFAVQLFGQESLVYFSIIFTLLILLISEILPKTIGVMYNRPLSVVLARPLQLLVLLFTPMIYILTKLTWFLQKKKKGPHTSEEDLRAVLSLTRKAGVIKPYEELSIRNILSLDVKTVKDVMTPRTVMASLPADITVDQAHQQRTIWAHSRIPVFEGDDPEDIVGIVYRREVLEALANDQNDLVLEKLMKPVRFVTEALTLDNLLIKFLESRVHLYIVLDEYGGTAGLVTLEDVLEEILGKEIVDETDQVVDMREWARQQRKNLVSSGGGLPDKS